MSKQSSFNKLTSFITIVLSIVILILFMTFGLVKLYLYTPAPQENNSVFINHDMRELYEPAKEETKFVVRSQINDIINSDNFNDVIIFYSKFTENHSISEAIITYSIRENVPINVVFALAWAESRFNPFAINTSNRNGTSDWGLFQLNDRYHRFTRAQYFDVHVNSERGITHFKDMMGLTNNDVIMSLYAYNAGYSRVVNNTVPDSTMQYVHLILEYEDMLNQEFNKWFSTHSY